MAIRRFLQLPQPALLSRPKLPDKPDILSRCFPGRITGHPYCKEDFLLSAFALLVHQYYGQSDVSFLSVQSGNVRCGSSAPVVEQCRVTIDTDATLDDLTSLIAMTDPTYDNQKGTASKPAIYITDANAAVEDDWVASLFRELDGIDILLVVSTLPEKLITRAYVNDNNKPVFSSHAFVESYRRLLVDVLSESSTRIVDINALSPFDRSRLMEWNERIGSEKLSTIHGLINCNYRERPSDIAISSTDESITYRDLGQRSAAVSCYLKSVGVRKGDRVGICLTKSPSSIVSIIGILRAGAAYVPVDPATPSERIAYIAQKVQMKTLVSEESIVKKLNLNGLGLHIVTTALYQDLKTPERWEEESETDPSSQAYIMFTSGSTGRPKGVVHEHHCVAGSMLESIKSFDLTDKTRFLHFASASFDASILEIFAPLTTGGALCIPSEEERLQNLESTMDRLKVTDASLTPVVASQIYPHNVPTLKSLSIGGDAPTKEILSRWSSHVRLNNVFGTTETGVWDTIKPYMNPQDHPKNIGKGIGVTCWIVDPSNAHKLRPVGVEGELLIQCPYLGRGYLNEPSREAESFIQPPEWAACFPWATSYRMYKTGDLARYDHNGDIIFCGRKSGFVKIRGLRVELGEIETRINSLLNGGRSAVVVRDEDGDPEIVAFVEKGHGQEMSCTNQIRGRLKNVLPSYMVPSIFIPIDTMPLTNSKKIDRHSLRVSLGQLASENLMKLRSGEGSNTDWHEIPAGRTIATEISHLVVDILEAKRTSSVEFLRGRDFPLVNAGLNSVHISFLAASIRKKYRKNITIADLHQPGITVCGVEEMIAGTKAGEVTKGSSRNLLEDLGAIKKGLPFSTETPPFQFASKTIFLTSITGFLGSQLLRFLLQHPSVNRIIGLVRAKDLDQAREKIKRQALIGQWWRDEYQSRIEIWLGDLSKPRLGLNQNNWTALAGKDDQTQIDGIIHNGAKVNWLEDYDTLEATNVNSTVDILSVIANMRVPCPLNYVSGGYLSFTNETQHQIARNLSKASGYDQTKFMSELILDEYNWYLQNQASRFPRAITTKPGFIVGTKDEGVGHTDDFLWRLAFSILKLGAISQDLVESHIPVAGVDQVASNAIENLFTAPGSTRVQFLDGVSMATFCDILHSQTGIPIKTMQHGPWMKMLQTDVEQAEYDHPFLPLMEWFWANAHDFMGNPSTDYNQHFVEEDIKAALAKSTAYMMDIGFLPSTNGHKSKKDVALFSRSG